MTEDRIGERDRQVSFSNLRSHPGLAAALAVFALVNGFLLVRAPVVVSGDGGWYVAGARILLHGSGLDAGARSCIGYFGLIACCMALRVGLGGVVAIQIASAIAAVFALYSMGYRLGGRTVGFLAALMPANPDVARFNTYILTDSLFISLSVVSVWCVEQARQQKGHWRWLAAAVMVFTALLRPNGTIVCLILALYWIGASIPSRTTRLALVTVLIFSAVAAAATFPPLRSRISMGHLGENLRRGVVIWGYPAANLKMPGAGRPPNLNEPAAAYVTQHPLASIHLVLARVVTEGAHTRPFYSRAHNFAMMALLCPLYVLALVGWVRLRRVPLVGLLAALIAAQALVTAFTWADWDGRFLLYVLPLIGVLGAAGYQQIASCYLRRRLESRRSGGGFPGRN